MTNTTDYTVTRPRAMQTESGIISDPALRGMIVAFVSGTDPREFELATGKKGYHLTRLVVESKDFAEYCMCDKLLGTPFRVGGAASADSVEEICVEGELVSVDPASSRAFDPAAVPAAPFPVTSDGGKIGLPQPGDEIHGWVQEIKAPNDPANGFALRIRVGTPGDCQIFEDPAAALKAEVA